jgi:hypothetical protein
MASKKRRSYRGAPGQHAAAAKVDLLSMRDELRSAERLLSLSNPTRSDCTTVLSYIRGAERDAGRYMAERGWSNRKDVKQARRFKTPSFRVGNKLRRIAMKFAAKCVR